MQRLVISTDGVPERERFTYWREVNTAVIGISGERGAESGGDFAARIDATLHPAFTRLRYQADSYSVFRRPRDIASRSWDDHIWLYRELGEGAWFDHDRREFVTRPGNLFVGDPTVPFATQPLRRYDIDLWFFPRALLHPHLPAAQVPRSVVLANRDGINGLVLGYLDAFADQLGSLGPAEAGAVADNFCRLLAVACGVAAGEQGDALAAARLEEVKRHIGLHLADPALTPETAAAALKMSVRQLHRLFEPTGTTFAQYVVQRRLEECRAALTGPGWADRSVTDIALGWGFNSLPTFYRTFQRAFGATPSELRQAAAQAGRHAMRHDLARAETTRL